MKYNVPIGYSGHERGTAVTLAAVALGAVIIERHITLNRDMEGPDHSASLEKKDFKVNLEMIAQMNKNKHYSTIARIEVADRLPHKSMSQVYTHIYKLELNLNYPPALRKVRDLADKNLFKLVKSMTSNPNDVIKALK